MQLTTKIFTAFTLCFLFFVVSPSMAQTRTTPYSKKEKEIIYKDLEGYVSIEKYIDGTEQRLKKIYINPQTGSYAYVVLKHSYLVLPREVYQVKLYRVNKDVLIHLNTHEVAFTNYATEIRFKYLFKNTGEYALEIHDQTGQFVKSIPVSVSAMKK